MTFPNDDWSERQEIISRCLVGERLILQHDAYNDYSVFATKVLRMNGEQLGHAPEYLAERIVERAQEGYAIGGVIVQLTGGDFEFDKPTRGVNFAVFYVDPSVPAHEVGAYVAQVLQERR